MREKEKEKKPKYERTMLAEEKMRQGVTQVAFQNLYFIYLLILCLSAHMWVCLCGCASVCAHMHAWACACHSIPVEVRGQLTGVVISFHHVDPGD